MRRIGILSLLTCLILTGCSTQDVLCSELVASLTNMADDSDYQTYLDLEKTGQLDSEGTYIVESVDQWEIPEGSVRITFGQNKDLRVTYSTDKRGNDPVSVASCWLLPGQSLYARPGEKSDNNSFALAEFRIREYDANDVLLQESTRTANNLNEPILTVPEQPPAGGYSIIPVGQYGVCTITTEVYYMDSQGEVFPLNMTGTWAADGKPFTTAEQSLSTARKPVLSYTFDNNAYFFVSAEPQPAATEMVLNTVTFPPADLSEGTLHYAVQLHPLITLEMTFDENAKIQINGEEEADLPKGEMLSKLLKYGDTVTVTTTGNCTRINCDPAFFTVSKLPEGGQNVYRLQVSKTGSGNIQDITTGKTEVLSIRRITLDPSIDHAVCTFEVDGEPVVGQIELNTDQEITLTCSITDDGWSFKGGNIFTDFINNFRNKKTVKIEVSSLGNGATVCASDYFELKKED